MLNGFPRWVPWAGAGVAIVLAAIIAMLANRSSAPAGPGPTAPSVPQTSTVSLAPIQVQFVQSEFATHYTVIATDTASHPITYDWSLTPPSVDPNCNNHGDLTSTTNAFVWHHPDALNSIPEGYYNCNHNVEGSLGHRGVVSLTVSDGHWWCEEAYPGTSGVNGVSTGVSAHAVCEPNLIKLQSSFVPPVPPA